MRLVFALLTAFALLVLASESGVVQASLYDCEDFHTQAEAQDWFDDQGFDRSYDPYVLDADNDGIVCEWGVDRNFYYDVEQSKPDAYATRAREAQVEQWAEDNPYSQPGYGEEPTYDCEELDGGVSGTRVLCGGDSSNSNDLLLDIVVVSGGLLLVIGILGSIKDAIFGKSPPK